MMQLTIEECDKQLEAINEQLPELHKRQQRIIGYRQALAELEEDEKENEKKPDLKAVNK